ncbi:hypothetical protein BCR39DRAFT_223769 [Naematelia encephala]|uniref:BTB domain-containing protein n=1 Tax=Naematelia encephala TaxID=71784 RepID=A0A1Y2AYL7_9TREE|nr:hypothetical protein BCR39DRAFT_223769 [Naematelia encephala]
MEQESPIIVNIPVLSEGSTEEHTSSAPLDVVEAHHAGQDDSFVEKKATPELDQTTSPKERKMHESYNEGDFTLISSDDVAFKLPKYQLLAMSVVFRNIFQIGIDTTSEISLDDETIEDSSTLCLVLDLAQGKGSFDVARLATYSPSANGRSVTPAALGMIRQVMGFIAKWDCPMVALVIRHIHSSLATSGEASVHELFRHGAMMYEPDICAMAIRAAALRPRFLTEPSEARLLTDQIAKASVFDVVAWRLGEFETVPPKYILALLRATRLCDFTRGAKLDWNAIADEFVRLVNTANTRA